MTEKIRYGMVGGGSGAFIGAVHRNAVALNNDCRLAAGCFSSHEDRNHATAAEYGIAEDRVYRNYQEMAKAESERPDGIQFVSVVTPNSTHYQICKAFLEAGISVMCEKPLCFTHEQAEELQKLTRDKNLLFGVTYTYTGYAMVKLAKDLIADGQIGDIINVEAEYLQDWLINMAGSGQKGDSSLSIWRTDPSRAGISNCVGDIGSHIEATVAYMTGLKLKRVAAVTDYYGNALDLNANMLLEYTNGAHGTYSCSQVCAGHLNGLLIRIYGNKGSVIWKQEEPDYLHVTRAGQPEQVYKRGTGYVDGRAAEVNHLPSGHPEGLTYAVANIYRSFVSGVRRMAEGLPLAAEDLDYTSIDAGVSGVRFIEAVIASGRNDAAWTEI